MTSLLPRLKQRKLAQWALAYLAGAWLFYQVATLVGQNFAWPPVVLRVLTVLLGVGFPAALVLAWYHGEQGRQRASGPELLMLAALFVVAGVAVVWARGDPAPEALPPVRPEAAGAEAGPADGAAPARSIAVLPFQNLSDDPGNAYFSDGVMEDVLTSLSQLGGLKVISRTSVMRYRDTEKPIRQIGQELGVATVLEGSVRRDGDRVRITAQLIDARTDEHLWAERYDRELTDLFAIQAEIAQRIAEALRAELTEGDLARLTAVPTADLEAYQLYLQARHLWFENTAETHARALGLYRQALALDSTFALAYAGLADVYTDLALRGDREQNLARARAAARHALALDSTVAGVHDVLAVQALLYEWDFDAAERGFRRALALDPNNAVAHFDYGMYLAFMGRLDEALVHHRRALELDPLTPWIAAMGLGRTLRLAGRTDEVIRLLRNVVRTSPDTYSGHYQLAEAYLATGRVEEGTAEMETAVRLEPGKPWTIAGLPYAYARAGREADARRLLRELEARDWQRQPRPSVSIARVYLALGEREAALDELERAVRERDPVVLMVRQDPDFAPLRGEPRFQRLLREIGFPP